MEGNVSEKLMGQKRADVIEQLEKFKGEPFHNVERINRLAGAVARKERDDAIIKGSLLSIPALANMLLGMEESQ